jgi:heat shock protein HslJ
MNFKIMTFVLAPFAILLSACGNPTPLKSNLLDGTSWELVAISKHPPIEESQISILFEGGQASGSSGCNRYGGGYKINGEEIVFDAMAMTEMACADTELMDQETEYMDHLLNAQRFEISDGQLLIYWSAHEALTFAPAQNP